MIKSLNNPALIGACDLGLERRAYAMASAITPRHHNTAWRPEHEPGGGLHGA